jgi:hypothetical protein
MLLQGEWAQVAPQVAPPPTRFPQPRKPRSLDDDDVDAHWEGMRHAWSFDGCDKDFFQTK